MFGCQRTAQSNQETRKQEEADIQAEFLVGLNGYYTAFPQAARSKWDLDVMVFDVTNFDIHDATEREDFLDKVEDFLETPQNRSLK